MNYLSHKIVIRIKEFYICRGNYEFENDTIDFLFRAC